MISSVISSCQAFQGSLQGCRERLSHGSIQATCRELQVTMQCKGSAVIACFWQIFRVVRESVTTSTLGAVCSPSLMDIVSRIPGPKVDHDDILFSQRLEFSHDIVPQREVEAPIRPARATTLMPAMTVLNAWRKASSARRQACLGTFGMRCQQGHTSGTLWRCCQALRLQGTAAE